MYLNFRVQQSQRSHVFEGKIKNTGIKALNTDCIGEFQFFIGLFIP